MENQPVPASAPVAKSGKPLAIGIGIAVALLAGGYAAYAYLNGSWPFASGQPTTSESPAAQVPADWKSYSNSAMAFSLKYPPTWNIREVKGTGPSGKFVYVSPPDALTDFSGSDVMLHLVDRDAETIYKEDSAACKDVLASGTIAVGGHAGWRLGCTSEIGGNYQSDYIAVGEGKTMVISHGFEVQEHLRVVATITFFDQTTGWKTYNSPVYGFAVKYPSNVQLKIVGANFEFMFIAPGEPESPYFFTGITILTRQQFAAPNHPQGIVLGETGEYVAILEGAQGCRSAEFCAEKADLAAKILRTLQFSGPAPYALQCGGTEAGGANAFGQQFPWYAHFAEQVATGWQLNSFCFNSELNQAVYIKSREDITQDGFLFFQLGVYDVASDTFAKAGVIQPGYFAGCPLERPRTTWAGPVITYECKGGDAGFAHSNAYTYNTATQVTKRIQHCDFSDEAGWEPTDKNCKNF